MTRPEGAFFFFKSKTAHSMKFSVLTNDLVDAKQAKSLFSSLRLRASRNLFKYIALFLHFDFWRSPPKSTEN